MDKTIFTFKRSIGKLSCFIAMYLWSNFNNIYRPLPLPFLEKVLFGVHELKATFNEDEESRKKNGGGKHVFFFNEKMKKVFLFGWLSLVPTW